MLRTVVAFLLGSLTIVLLILFCLVLRGAEARPAAKWEAWMTGAVKRRILVRGKSTVNPR